jgi:hypothetical protein
MGFRKRNCALAAGAQPASQPVHGGGHAGTGPATPPGPAEFAGRPVQALQRGQLQPRFARRLAGRPLVGRCRSSDDRWAKQPRPRRRQCAGRRERWKSGACGANPWPCWWSTTAEEWAEHKAACARIAKAAVVRRYSLRSTRERKVGSKLPPTELDFFIARFIHRRRELATLQEPPC